MREKKNKIFDWVWAVTIGMGEKKEEKNIWLNGIKKKKCLDGERMGKCRRDGVAGCGYGRGIGS